MLGKTLGKYRIVEKIGRGGMGVVYLGVDETPDRKVAIKAIPNCKCRAGCRRAMSSRAGRACG